MALTTDDVTRIASLARIKIPEKDKPQLATDLSGILTWIEKLNQVKTDGVSDYSDLYAVIMQERSDIVTDGDQVDCVIAGGPEVAHHMFAVPKVVE